MEEKIQNEQWYKELADDLRQLKKWRARINILEAKMIRETGPVSKLTAQYGDGITGAGTREDMDEQELDELKARVQAIEFALDALTEDERKIIALKFFERKKDVIIYEMELLMAPATFYSCLNRAMKTMKYILKKN